MTRLWRIGNTFEPAPNVFAQVTQVFSRKVTSGYQAGDFVVFGNGRHFAYVTGPGSQGSKVMIESKDNGESIVRGGFDLNSTTDPIIQRNGKPEIYRLVGPVQVTEIAPGNCDIIPLTINLDVNELLKGTFRQLDGAEITIQDSNGTKIASGRSGADGKASIVIPSDKVEQSDAASSCSSHLRASTISPTRSPRATSREPSDCGTSR